MVLFPRLNHFLLLLPLVVTSSLGLIVMPHFTMHDYWIGGVTLWVTKVWLRRMPSGIVAPAWPPFFFLPPPTLDLRRIRLWCSPASLFCRRCRRRCRRCPLRRRRRPPALTVACIIHLRSLLRFWTPSLDK